MHGPASPDFPKYNFSTENSLDYPIDLVALKMFEKIKKDISDDFSFVVLLLANEIMWFLCQI